MRADTPLDAWFAAMLQAVKARREGLTEARLVNRAAKELRELKRAGERATKQRALARMMGQKR